jgi:hypothetical protein
MTTIAAKKGPSSDDFAMPSASAWIGTTKEVHSQQDFFNQVLDSYLKGKEEGYKQAMSELGDGVKARINRNFSTATTVSLKIEKEIKKLFGKSSAANLLLRADTISRFCLAILLTEDEFYSEKKYQLREKLLKIKQEANKGDFSIDFTILPTHEGLNTQKLSLDGYTLQYVGKTQQNRPSA